ncbi:uncharacterized protein LODBEIA_P23850 [Lodderomyces beijingensis]|uniref:Mediator of RNA polymerase II transcription subunit 21 n=1 Tax=Lodderomyces beijingensis TaxID=1775926 RepID=A0ABP0ZMP5_9ASCO
MEDKTYDDISAISTLVFSLNQKINDSAETLGKLEETVRKLAPVEDHARLLKEPQLQSKSNPDGNGAETELDEKELKLRRLQEERLLLVMELQKQDFITEKLKDIIDQNQEVLETVKEYLASHDRICREDEQIAKNRLQNYIENSIEPTLKHLQN